MGASEKSKNVFIHCKMYSLNVRGIRERDKREQIFSWCKDKKADIVFLQETFSTRDIEDRWSSMWDGSIYFSHGSNHGKGVLVLISPMVDIEVIQVLQDTEGRYIFIDCKIQGVRLILGNVYFPTRNHEKDQLIFLRKLRNILDRLNKNEYPVIVGGDFNMIRNTELDYLGQSSNRISNRFNQEIENFMQEMHLLDIWRSRHPLKRQFTYTKKKPFMQSRLDYWMISESLEELVMTCDIMPSISPDHHSIFLHLFDKTGKNSEKKRGSYWKFNNSLCENKDYVKEMKKQIIELKNELQFEIKDKRLLWDMMKMKIRSFTQKFSKRLAKERRMIRTNLEKQVQDLEQKLVNDTSENILEELENAKKKLREVYSYVNEGVKIRSRASWYENGEKDPRYFNQLIQNNKKKSTIKKIKTLDGVICSDEKKITEEIRKFYSNLYSKVGNENSDDCFVSFFQDLPKLTKESREYCEGPIRNGECLDILKELKPNKSPGNDGFTTEFYNTFWPDIGGLVREALNEAYRLEELASSQKQAVITLIAKDGKDPFLLKNYRPISLLNVDYKILTKILAKRIKEVLNEIIMGDQVGYMKGRNIGEAIRIIDDIIFHTTCYNLPGFLLAIDFEKAFDSISHQFLQKVLSSFGFGPSFQKWVKILYTNTLSCVLNEGGSTGYFKVERGVRQGDPLSSYLFILCIEIMAHKLRTDNLVEGINFGDKEIKSVLYADDMTIFARNVKSINRLKVLFADFEKLSGLKINRDKTKVLRLGLCQCFEFNFSFGEIVDFVKVLGVFFSLDVHVKENMNYKEILSKIKSLLNFWKQRDLTLMGKIQLLKVHIYSKVIYRASLTPVPRWVYDSLDKLAFDFIWKGKKDKINRNTMFLGYKQGGLKMLNFPAQMKSQRIMWVKKLLNKDEDMKWKHYFNFVTRHIGGEFIFSCDYLPGLLKVTAPQFYMDILEEWVNTRHVRSISNNQSIGDVVIFNNKLIRYKGNCIYDKKLHEKGVYKLKHILGNDGKLKSDRYFAELGLETTDIDRLKHFYECIPLGWKRNFRKEENNNSETDFILGGTITNISNLKSKQIYLQLIKKEKSEPLVFERIERNYGFSCKEIENIFLRLRHCTLNSRLREFQFKLIHGIIYTNHHLFRFGLVSSDLCSFCEKEEETYKHLFYSCEYAQLIWESCTRFVKYIDLRNCSWKEILFGREERNKGKHQLLNHILILVKYLIFKNRNHKKPPSINEITNNIVGDRLEENKLALMRGTLTIHYSKWENLNDNQQGRARSPSSTRGGDGRFRGDVLDKGIEPLVRTQLHRFLLYM